MDNGTGSRGLRLPPGFENLVSSQGTGASGGFGKFSEEVHPRGSPRGNTKRDTKRHTWSKEYRERVPEEVTRGLVERLLGR